MERESHWQYMKRRMREEDNRLGICKDFMSPLDAARRIRSLEERIKQLEETVAELRG
jgi:hypothetical protein